MTRNAVWSLACLAALTLAIGWTAAKASDSADFDAACPNYYTQGNDPDVLVEAAVDFCTCLANELSSGGLAVDALDFFARTYSDDLTAFIHEYPEGDAWMSRWFEADAACKAG